MTSALSPTELTALAAVRVADEDEGGLSYEDLDDAGREAVAVLAARGLVEARAGEEGSAWVRITWRGAEVLRDLGLRRE